MKENKKFIIDGSNIAYLKRVDGKPSFKAIQIVINCLYELFENPQVIVIVKADLRHKATDTPILGKLEREGVLHQIPGYVDDDALILAIAYETSAYIISNDHFNDKRDFDRDWLRQHIIKCAIIDDKVYFFHKQYEYGFIPKAKESSKSITLTEQQDSLIFMLENTNEMEEVL